MIEVFQEDVLFFESLNVFLTVSFKHFHSNIGTFTLNSPEVDLARTTLAQFVGKVQYTIVINLNDRRLLLFWWFWLYLHLVILIYTYNRLIL